MSAGKSESVTVDQLACGRRRDRGSGRKRKDAEAERKRREKMLWFLTVLVLKPF